MTINIALFASGSGSNAENIVNQLSKNQNFNFPLIISNKSDAFVHQRAANLKIDSFTFNKQEFDEADKLIALLDKYNISHLVLAGFLLKISSKLIQKYPDRIINIHPALLPKYGGKGMYGDHVHKAVAAAKETETGISIHYVNEHYDEGNIIFQAKCNVLPTDDYTEIAQKVHSLEYEHFPKVIEQLWG